PHIIKIVSGNLSLHRCRLQGPLGKSPDSFRALIAIAGPADMPLKCRLSECVLLSGKSILNAAVAAVQVSARQDVVVSPGDALLRIPQPLLARGQLLWQGKGNAFDRRLQTYCAIAGRAAEKEALADWLQLWGRAGEQDALVVEPGPAAKTTVNVDVPQLDRLA